MRAKIFAFVLPMLLAIATIVTTLAGMAFADEVMFGKPVNGLSDDLVRFDDRYYHVRQDESVSTTVLGHSRVRKIGYGQSSYVDIVTTPTGTYSSDAMYSPHVRYPGIEVERAFRHSLISIWTSTRGWSGVSSSGSSFVHIRNTTSSASSHGGRTCVSTSASFSCH